MGKKSKKFINKKTDTVYSFRVGARSQQDPLVTDETAPQGVLIEENAKTGDKGKVNAYGIYFDDDYDYLKHIKSSKEGINWNDHDLEVYEIRKEDPKAGKKNKKLQLPSSVFESFVEEPIGMLNKAAPISGPCPELDPDVVAHLDDDFNVALDKENTENMENILEMFGKDDEEWEDAEEDEEIWGTQDYCYEEVEGGDDGEMPALEEEYMASIQAMPERIIKKSKTDDGEEGDDEGSDNEDRFFDSDDDQWSVANADKDFGSVSFDSDEERDQVGSLTGPAHTFKDEETKSRFTEYSLSSSVNKRNKGLTDLDDRFEALYIREYNEEQIGPLDGEEIEGFVDEKSELYRQVLEATKKQFEKHDFSEKDNQQSWINNWIKDLQIRTEKGEIAINETEEIEVKEKDYDNKWDCQSILSTYSNIYNHPKMIGTSSKITIDPSTGLPRVQIDRRLTRKNLAMHDDDVSDSSDDDVDDRTLISNISAISYRPPNETPEERRARKGALKELRRERRYEKKLNRIAFKHEKKLQEKIAMNKKHSNVTKVV